MVPSSVGSQTGLNMQMRPSLTLPVVFIVILQCRMFYTHTHTHTLVCIVMLITTHII